ncbi:hypothetical protein C8R43DRAFT_1131413 [Mycena crocata]|nr:hypothetical protein C8R43DRAFT_1131413 [Mycena crocata]
MSTSPSTNLSMPPPVRLQTWVRLPRDPPFEYLYTTGKPSESGSDSTAFRTGINNRDSVEGNRACVVCGNNDPAQLEDCHIINQSEAGKTEPKKWKFLQYIKYVPVGAKNSPVHEPRNGITMCKNHHGQYDGFNAFIRYFPRPVHAYVWFEFERYSISDMGELMTTPTTEFHGRRLRLDASHDRAPIYSLLLLQEVKARAFHALMYRQVEDGVDLANPREAYTPTWLSDLYTSREARTAEIAAAWSAGGYDNEDKDHEDRGWGTGGNNEDRGGGMDEGDNNTGDRDGGMSGSNGGGGDAWGGSTPDSNAWGGSTSTGMHLADVWNVLKATHHSQSWVECSRENAREGVHSGTGTADENVASYLTKMERSNVSESVLHHMALFTGSFSNAALA